MVHWKNIVVDTRCWINAAMKIKQQNRKAAAKKKRRYRLNCSLSQAEIEVIAQKADKAGLSPTAYLKKAALAYMNKKYLIPKDVQQELQKITVLLRNIGTNINQMALRTNKLKKTTVFDLYKAKELIGVLENQIDHFIYNPLESADQIPE